MAKCCICDCEKKENLKILGKYICADCEWKILTTQVHSSGYNKCVSQLKKIIRVQ